MSLLLAAICSGSVPLPRRLAQIDVRGRDVAEHKSSKNARVSALPGVCNFTARPPGVTTVQTDAHNMGREERRALLEQRRSRGTPIAASGNRINGPRQTA